MHKKLAEEMEVDEHLRYVPSPLSIEPLIARAPSFPPRPGVLCSSAFRADGVLALKALTHKLGSHLGFG